MVGDGWRVARGDTPWACSARPLRAPDRSRSTARVGWLPPTSSIHVTTAIRRPGLVIRFDAGLAFGRTLRAPRSRYRFFARNGRATSAIFPV